MDEKEIIVFYSWQSNSPRSTNLAAIRNSLRVASSTVEAKLVKQNIKITVDEATRNVPGSPNIPNTIAEKIEASNIFVCDVTPIAKSTDNPPEGIPNPNVVFELGYAVAHLGWSRIVLLFNEAFGSFPVDLPFDFDRHRASHYALSEATASAFKKNSHPPLDGLLVDAIEAVISNNPKRPSELRELAPELLRRTRDISNLRWLMEYVHWPTLEQHIQEGPKLITGRYIYFFEGFSGVRRAHLFDLFDKELLDRVDAMYRAWSVTVSFGARYEGTGGNSDYYVFSVPPNRGWTKGGERLEQDHQGS